MVIGQQGSAGPPGQLGPTGPTGIKGRAGSPRLSAEHLLCTVPWSGPPCLTTSAHSRTMFLLNRAWKPGCSLDTSVHSTLETFVTMRYINLHLPCHTIPSQLFQFLFSVMMINRDLNWFPWYESWKLSGTFWHWIE